MTDHQEPYPEYVALVRHLRDDHGVADTSPVGLGGLSPYAVHKAYHDITRKAFQDIVRRERLGKEEN